MFIDYNLIVNNKNKKRNWFYPNSIEFNFARNK